MTLVSFPFGSALQPFAQVSFDNGFRRSCASHMPLRIVYHSHMLGVSLPAIEINHYNLLESKKPAFGPVPISRQE